MTRFARALRIAVTLAGVAAIGWAIIDPTGIADRALWFVAGTITVVCFNADRLGAAMRNDEPYPTPEVDS